MMVMRIAGGGKIAAGREPVHDGSSPCHRAKKTAQRAFVT